MALTLRTNGSGGSNLVSAAWWNDYYNLLTGGMQDQEVTVQNNVVIKSLGGAPAAPIGAATSGGTLSVGIFGYLYTFLSADGESYPSTAPGISTTNGNQQIQLSNIPIGPTGTTGRNIYRTAVGGGTAYKLCHTIADNTTTSYLDNNSDASLGALSPVHSTFGGSLILKDASGVVTSTLTNDGYLITGGITFAVGSLSRVCLVIGVGTGGNTAYNHTLGTTPTYASVMNAGTYTNPQPASPTYVGGGSSTINVNAASGITFWAVLWRQ